MIFYIFFSFLLHSLTVFAMDAPPAINKGLNYKIATSDSWRLIRALDFDAYYFPENDVGVFAKMASQQKWGNFYNFFKQFNKVKKRIYRNNKNRGKISRSLLDRSNRHFPMIVNMIFHLNKSIDSDIRINSEIFDKMLRDLNRALHNLEEHKFFMLCDGVVEIATFSILLTRKGVFKKVLKWEKYGDKWPLEFWLNLDDPDDQAKYPEVIEAPPANCELQSITDTPPGNRDLQLIINTSSANSTKKKGKGIKNYLWSSKKIRESR